ncbi:hypothetical protein [Rhodoplanes serenus]|uniref:hypothetical protein n=1 Tax=Rhodoplanes serenus TaxID=200615 RepID=UPI000DAD9DE9|nr:hypothetical protein [Rhodoplanes serenus]RAI29421.1 hypothetical protein CH340_22825 [Rhodoplanes serenus]
MSAPRLTEEQKRAILHDYLSGLPLRAIAARHKVDTSYPVILAKRRGKPLRSARQIAVSREVAS